MKTGWSVYLVGLHRHDGRRMVVMRGEPGGDKQDLMVRDSDPRIGERSLWDVPTREWPGHALDVAMVVTSPIESVTPVQEPAAIAAITNGAVQPQRTAVAVVTGQASAPKQEQRATTRLPGEPRRIRGGRCFAAARHRAQAAAIRGCRDQQPAA